MPTCPGQGYRDPPSPPPPRPPAPRASPTPQRCRSGWRQPLRRDRRASGRGWAPVAPRSWGTAEHWQGNSEGATHSSRRSGSRVCIWCSPSCVRRLPRGRTRPGRAAFQREGPAPAEAPRGETPFQAGAGLALSPLSPTPQALQGPASLGPQLAAARHLSAKSFLWPAALACGHFKSAAEKGPGSLSPRTWGGGGAPAEPRPCTWCPIGLFTLAHTALLVARTTPAPGTSFAGAPKMSPPVPQVWVVAPQRGL